MARMILAEPELPNLLAAGRPEEIRPCVYHYRCIGNIFVRGQVRCAANGSVGREDELVIGASAASPRSVLVVGGGPSGMEAARVAALRGHSVTLVDAAPRLGGRWAVRGRDVRRQRRSPAVARAPARARRVTYALGERLDAEAAVASGADAVVIATGTRWGLPAFPGADLPHVHAVDDLGAWLFERIAGGGARRRRARR